MESRKFDKSWLIFIAAAIVFLAIKIPAAHYSISDENTYYKMGQLVAGGQVPYRDFFFAHTPLQAYVYGAVFKLAGFNLLLLKMISALSMVVAAAFVLAIAKDRLNAKIAAAASALFLFSYGTLLFSNFPTGAELAVPFVVGAFYFFLRKKHFAAGVLAGIATGIYQFSALAAAVFIMTAPIKGRNRKAVMMLFTGFAATLAAVALPFVLIAKGEFIRQTLLYHFQKPAEDVSKGAIFLRVVKTNALLFILAAIAIISRNRAKTLVITTAAVAAAYLAAFPLMKTAFNYYLLYLLPFLAILAGYGIETAYIFLSEKVKFTKGMAVAVVITVVLASATMAARQFTAYNAQDFPQAEDTSTYVRENSLPNQEIFGDDSTVPLISLLSGREIALNSADNNAMRYKSGESSMQATIEKLQEKMSKKELRFILLRRIKTETRTFDFGIGTVNDFMSFVDEKCTLAKEYGQMHVYDCLKT